MSGMFEDNVPAGGNGAGKKGSEYLRSFVKDGTADAAHTGADGTADAAHTGADLLDFLIRRRNAAAKGEDDATKKARERREKRQRLLAGIADGLGSMYNSYARMRGNGMRPLQTRNYSGAVRRAQDEARKKREALPDEWLRYSLMIDKLQKEDRDFNWGVAKQVAAQGNTEAQQAETDRSNKANEALRGRTLDETERSNKENEALRGRTLKETERSHKANEALRGRALKETERSHKANEALQGQRIAKMGTGSGSGYVEFGTGDDMIRVPKSRMNEANIARVFMMTPEQGRPTGTGSLLGGQRMPSKADMLAWIGQNMDVPGVVAALRKLQGEGDGADDAAPTGDDDAEDWEPGM